MNTNLKLFHLMHLNEIGPRLDYALAKFVPDIHVATHGQKRRARGEGIEHEQKSKQNLALGHIKLHQKGTKTFGQTRVIPLVTESVDRVGCAVHKVPRLSGGFTKGPLH